jgi:uncharacterized protein (TIGR03085 family)
MTDVSTAYTDLPDAPSGPSVSRVERALLCDLLEQVGPSAPTLCEGWDAYHLVAHLRGREGANPVRSVMSAIPKLGDRSVEHLVSRNNFTTLVDEVRAGPPRLSLFAVPRLEPLLNLLEFFVHHEDARRGSPGWEPRALPGWANDQIWAKVVGLGKLTQRRAPTGVVLERADTGDSVRVSKGDDAVVVRGLPGEVALYLAGRQRASRAELLGSPAATSAFTDHLSGS